MGRHLYFFLGIMMLLVSACGASDEELRLAFLLENPMASASLPFAEPVSRVEREGDFDPPLGSASGSLVSTNWELEEEDQLEEALELLVEQAEIAGFVVELTFEGAGSGTVGYDGVSDDGIRVAISGGTPTDLFPARVSVSLR